MIRVNGSEEIVDIEPKDDLILHAVYKLINCDCVDVVRLRQRKQIMLVDDIGYAKELPLNPRATQLYHSVCVPGTTNPIVGDVVLVEEEDFK